MAIPLQTATAPVFPSNRISPTLATPTPNSYGSSRMGSDSSCSTHSPSPRLLNQETERLSTLAQVLLDTIRCYNKVFTPLLWAWILHSTIVCCGLVEFLLCYFVDLQPQRVQNQTFWWLDNFSGEEVAIFQESNSTTSIPELLQVTPDRWRTLLESLWCRYELIYIVTHLSVLALDLLGIFAFCLTIQLFWSRILRY